MKKISKIFEKKILELKRIRDNSMDERSAISKVMSKIDFYDSPVVKILDKTIDIKNKQIEVLQDVYAEIFPEEDWDGYELLS